MTTDTTFMDTDTILTHPLYLAAKDRYRAASAAFDKALMHDTDTGLNYLRARVDEAQDDLSATYADLATR